MLGFLTLVAAFGVIGAAALASRNAHLRVIEEAFRSLGGDPVRAHGGVEGPVGGHVVHYAVFPVANNRYPRTICRVTLSIERPAFEMDLRTETRSEQRDVEHGRAIDLVLGDEAFDDSFVVEAAPAEVAHALLDERARTALLTFYRCRLTIAGTELHFTKNEALSEPAEIRRVLELCIHVASSLEALPSLLHEQRLVHAREGGASGYRGPTPEAMRALATTSETASELATLRQMRVRRKRRTLIQGVVIFVVGTLVSAFISSSRHR
jgi:hypothetical protein